MTKQSNQLLAMRNKELVNSYKRILRDEYAHSGTIDRRHVVMRVLRESRPMFHVSYQHAYKVLSVARRHGFDHFKQPHRRQMWRELSSLVDDEMRMHPHLCMSHALSRVLASRRASSFYLSPDYCYKLLGNIYKLH